ncbi:porin [Pseudomonas sp. gcc21]|uniref:porin n=1 Tax=Pseudomonas sp. gcc21 TaxID=2726989 RepID=UPI00145186A9|nr:porin [Pseudomonas sp. gcc21]QJD59900.1 porin [Pseudomonas sp. gcc21]
MRSSEIKRLYLLPVALPVMLSLSSAAHAYSFDVDIDKNPATEETFEIYGKVRLSVDYGDSDLGSTPENKSSGLTDGSIGLSSNTTLFGIRGSYALENDPYTIVWQLETKFNPDTDGGDTLGTRDTFLGVKTPVGLFRAGHMDTPFKAMGIRNSLFVATAADPMAILGKSSVSGARLDLRAQNALKWDHAIQGLTVSALYSFDGQRGTEGSSDRFIDTNEDDVYSMSLGYKLGPVMLMGAYENWADAFGGSIDAWRVGARYTSGPITAGAIFGDIDTDDSVAGGSLSRSEYGAYLSYNVTQRTSVAGQWMHADESDIAEGGDDANQYSIGIFHKLSKPLTLHAVATMTDNSANGRYGTADFAHGDRVATVDGGSPYVVSVGAEFQF